MIAFTVKKFGLRCRVLEGWKILCPRNASIIYAACFYNSLDPLIEGGESKKYKKRGGWKDELVLANINCETASLITNMVTFFFT